MHNRSNAVWASLVVVMIAALLAGFSIARMGGGPPDRSEASRYIPPPTRTATAIVRTVTPSPTRSPTRRPAASTLQPTRSATAPPTSAATPASPPATGPAATGTSAVAPTLAQVPSGPVNLRSGPGSAYPVLGLAPAGGIYPVMARSADGEWWQVCCVGSAPAWVASSVISVTGSIETLPILDR